MDKDGIIADREGRKIRGFMNEMLSQGKLTAAEFRLLDKVWESLPGSDVSEAALDRHSNELQKKKLVELHPELKGELERFIEHRPYHPLPPVPPNIAGPGAALSLFQELIDYIASKREQGVLTEWEANRVYDPARTVFEDSGVYMANLDDKTDKRVLAQAHHQMKKKLLEIHPELADEVRNLGSSRPR